jgi:general secretion pathway protein A
MQADIYCYRSNGGLAELRALNRPAIVALQDGNGAPRYALLSGLGINTIAIRSAGTVQLVNALALARYFQGNFVTAWRAPAGFSGPINPGDKSPAAGWVAQRLNVLVSENAEMASTIAMTRAVRDFQITQGLKADGIAGPKTIMYINRATGVDEPHLDLLAELAGK